MQQLREIRRRIASIEEIRKITKAMYTIALSRTFRLKVKLQAARAYAAAAEEALGELLRELAGEQPPHPLLVAREGPEAIFVVNSDRGLCGRFPEELNRRAEELLASAGAETDKAVIIAGGERARRHFARRGIRIIKAYINFYDRPEWPHAAQIARELLELFHAEKISGVSAIYMRFLSELRQEVAQERLLPFSSPSSFSSSEGEGARRPQRWRPLTIYEPGPAQILEGFAWLYLAAKVYNILLESKTSEQALRRQTMKAATDNADELIEELTLEFNKARQQSITKEIADIIGGTEALRGGG